MKLVVMVLSLSCLVFSAPRASKLFYEHFEDFLQLILEESGEELELLLQQYLKYHQFLKSMDYMRTKNFTDIICEIESLPEFKAVVHYLEEDNIDFIYFIDVVNQLLGNFNTKKGAHHRTSGKNVTSYMKDSINLFPKEKLLALFNQKAAEHNEFRATIEKLRSPKWQHLLHALWTNKSFKTHKQILARHGIDIAVLVMEVKAIFGQN